MGKGFKFQEKGFMLKTKGLKRAYCANSCSRVTNGLDFRSINESAVKVYD